jgi:hypothetical protein
MLPTRRRSAPAGRPHRLAKPREQRSPQEQAEIFNHWRATAADFATETAKLEELWKQWPKPIRQCSSLRAAAGADARDEDAAAR